MFYKFLFRHPADPGEVLKRLAARNGGDLHVDQGLRYGRTACLSLYANRREGRGKAKHLSLRQSGLLTGTGDAHGHLNDRRFGGSEVVAQLSDHTAHVAEQRLVRTHDIGELGQLRRGGVSVQVCGGFLQVYHDPCEVLDVFRGDAQLAAGGHDVIDVCGRGCHLGRHFLGRCGQAGKFLLRPVYGLSHCGKGRFKVYR